MRVIYFLFLIFITGCDSKSNPSDDLYPPGMSVHDMTLTNDCTLPECSDERIVRLIAKNVKGQIQMTLDSQWVVFYPFTFDSYILFYLCDLPDEFQVDALDIRYDGKAIDACGIRMDSWPVEEVYTLVLSKIERL